MLGAVGEMRRFLAFERFPEAAACLAMLPLAGCAGNGEVKQPDKVEVCAEGQCGPADRFSREQLVGGLLVMLKNNENASSTLCEAKQATRECAHDALEFFVQGGPLPGVGSIDAPTITQVGLDKTSMQVKYIAVATVHWNGTPVICQNQYTEITVTSPNEITIDAPSFACTWTVIPMVWHLKFAVSYIDFDHGVIGGNYSTGGAGLLVVGGGDGSFVMRLPKAAAAAANAKPTAIAQLPAQLQNTPVPTPEQAANGEKGNAPAAQVAVARQTLEGRRVALVVGNANYQNVPRLANTANDARLVAETLRRLGFELVGGGPLLDLDRTSFVKAVASFGDKLNGSDAGVFYYAGHGLQMQGANFLVPVDANPSKPSDADIQLVDANLVLHQMEDSGAKLKVVILDACRNNPFGGRGLRDAGGGLAQMRAPEGTLISYATQPGNVAQDGPTGADSPYTVALARAMATPGLDAMEMFNQVGLLVDGTTQGAQQPWLALSPIKGKFYFAGR